MEFFHTYRGGYVRKIKDRLYKHFNLFDDHQLNKNSSAEECIAWKSRPVVETARQQLFTPIIPDDPNLTAHVDSILSDVFSYVELFGTVIVTMMLDLNYQRGDIDSTELVIRMENWSGAPWDEQVFNFFIISIILLLYYTIFY